MARSAGDVGMGVGLSGKGVGGGSVGREVGGTVGTRVPYPGITQAAMSGASNAVRINIDFMNSAPINMRKSKWRGYCSKLEDSIVGHSWRRRNIWAAET